MGAVEQGKKKKNPTTPPLLGTRLKREYARRHGAQAARTNLAWSQLVRIRTAKSGSGASAPKKPEQVEFENRGAVLPARRILTNDVVGTYVARVSHEMQSRLDTTSSVFLEKSTSTLPFKPVRQVFPMVQSSFVSRMEWMAMLLAKEAYARIEAVSREVVCRGPKNADASGKTGTPGTKRIPAEIVAAVLTKLSEQLSDTPMSTRYVARPTAQRKKATA
jgi:hypothetical protein